MRGNNLPKSKILEIANMFTAQAVSIYELELMSGVSATVILKIFNKDLYEINEEKAIQVNRILNAPGYINFKGYIKEYAKN